MPYYKPDKLPKLMVAPNGARRIKKDHPAVPLTINETVETAKACYKEGAEAIHLHVRDENGQKMLFRRVSRRDPKWSKNGPKMVRPSLRTLTGGFKMVQK